MKKVLVFLLATALVLSMGLAMAAPVGAASGTLYVRPMILSATADEATAAWSQDQAQTGSYSAHLKTTGTVNSGHKATVRVEMPSGTTLGSITSVSWQRYLVAGYVPHLDIKLEGGITLTVEGAYANSDQTVANFAQNVWAAMFDGGDGGYPAWATWLTGSVTNTTQLNDDMAVWRSGSGGAAGFNVAEPGEIGTDRNLQKLSTYRAGWNGISDATVVEALEIEVDNWVHQTEAYVDAIEINGTVYYGLIQDAIDAATGTTIEVAAGTYVEDLVIPAGKDGLEIAGAGAATTKIKGVAFGVWDDWPNHAVATGIESLANEVKIHGFTIETPDVVAGYAFSIVLTGAGVEIFDNIFVGVGDAASYSVAIQTFRVNAMPTSDITGLQIYDNLFSSDFTANGGAMGFYQGVFINRDSANGLVTISGNTFTGNIHTGIANEGDKAVISGNTLTSDYAGAGIVVMDWESTRDQDDVAVTGNTVSGFDRGIVIGHGSGTQVLTNISVTCNTVHDNYTGILVRSSAGGVVVNYNNIFNNPSLLTGLSNTDDESLDARWNWWGDASGPSGGDAVSDNVLFYPWLHAEADCLDLPYLLDHFKLYNVVEGEPVGVTVGLEDQFGSYEAMVLEPLFFGNPAAKEHEGVLTDIWNPDDHLTFYSLSPQAETQTWCVEVYNQFGLQNFKVADPVILGVPTRKQSHPAFEGPDHYLLYEVIDGEPLGVTVWLWDQWTLEEWETTLVFEPVYFANPVDKNGEGIENDQAHLVFYRIVGVPYLGPDVWITNQFGFQIITVSEAAFLAVPSDKLCALKELVIEDVTMQYNVDGGDWTAAGGSFAAGFSVCLDATAGEWYYLGVDELIASRDVKVCELNPFYLKIVDSETFDAWWADKMAGWSPDMIAHMEKILAGDEPMFYLHFDGDDYKLIDGFQYWLYSGGSNTLRLHSDYPPGTYTFEGAVAGAECCESAVFQVVMTFCAKPMISFGFNGVEAGHNAEFEYCYGVPVTVTLHEIYAGEAPFSVTYKIDGGDPVTVEDLGKGGVIEAGQVLDPGTYTITVTAIEDANGCFASQAFLDLCVATVTIHPLPEVTDFTLQYKIDEGEWEAAEGSFATGFTIYLDAEAGTWYYLDVDTLTANVDLKVCELNPFYLKDVDSEDFVDWWADKFAEWDNETWEAAMQSIIDGGEPMFYLHYTDEGDYWLIDGFTYLVSSETMKGPLRLDSEYPPGTYTFEGTVAGADCCTSEPFQVVITFVDEVVPLAEIQGQTKEVNCEPLTGVTITLLQNGTVIATTESDGTGNYTLVVAGFGEYRVVASMAGFRDRERSVSVTELTAYTVDFVADHGLIPDAPNMSYVLACINLWQYGEPHCKLTMSTVLAVINAWQYPILEGEIT